MWVRFEEFALDTERRELNRNGQSIRLTPKAFDLLSVLVERRPRAVPQDDLFDHLWPDTLVDLSRIHQLVQEIRGALHDEERTIIRTVYGRGYSFALPAVADDESVQWHFKLVVGEHSHILRQGINMVGRDYACSIRIQESSVSRRHARILIDSDRATVEDLSSRNGTFVNGQAIHSTTGLQHADSIRFGSIMASFLVLDPLTATE